MKALTRIVATGYRYILRISLCKVVSGLVLVAMYVCTFNKLSGNFLVTSASSIAWKDTLSPVDVGLVTERTNSASCRGADNHKYS